MASEPEHFAVGDEDDGDILPYGVDRDGEVLLWNIDVYRSDCLMARKNLE